MKVFISGTSYKPEYGGPAVSVPSLAEGLSKLGIEVGIWASDGSASQTKREYFQEETATNVKLLDGTLDAALAAFGTPDIIHDNGIWLPHNHKIATLARRFNVPRVVTIRGMLEPWAIRYRPLKKAIAWRLYQKADLQSANILHATSLAEKEHIGERGLTNPVQVIPNGVPIPDISARNRDESEAEHPTVLFLGRLHPKKGIPMLLDAWSELSTHPWKLRIVGPAEDAYDKELLSKIAARGLEHSVTLTGARFGAEKAREYLAARLFVLPTYSENFGISVAEAMSYAIPVITTTGAPWSIVKQRKAGWYVEPTKDALKAALASAMAKQSSELKRMGQNGRKIVESDFSWERIAAAIRDLYVEAKRTER